MEFYIIDTNFNILAIVDTYKSVIWTKRYFTSGDFELYVAATQEMLEVLRKNYYVVRTDDTTQCMIIENIEITTDIENGNYLIVTGRSLSSILSRRVILGEPTGTNQYYPTTVNGTVEHCIRKLVYMNAIEPNGGVERQLTGLVLSDEILGITTKINAQFTGNNLEETIQNICKSNDLGYDILFDLENKKFIFVLLQGKNRSYSQSENDFVVFSNEFENLLTSNYKENSENFKNAAYIAGEGEGVNRKYASVTFEGASNLSRYELFVDARDVSTNNGEITDDEYNELLVERASEKLAEHQTTRAIEGEVEPNYNYKFGVDYFLGDIVEVLTDYGVGMTPRITEVIESVDDTGHYVIPTFSNE